MEGVGASETLAGMAETDDQKTASERQPALPAEVSGSRTHEPERELDPPSSPAPLTNEEAPRGSSQTAPMESGTEAPITSRPSTPVNTRYSLPRSRPTSPVPSLKNFESVRPSSPQRPDSPLEPSRTGLEKASGSPRANSPFLQKAQSFGRSNVSAKRISSMLVEKRGHSGLRADYEEDQVSPRAFEVKPLADTDGLCAVLYHYLWRKTGKGKGCPGLNLPDTIVYRYRQPMHWFFTSVHDGQLMKKNRSNVLNRLIFESLSKSRGRVSDIVACHLYTDDELAERTKRPNEQVTHVEYFDEAGLKNFLFHGEKQMHGVLQRFVESKGDRNALIQAMWSPQVCLLERRINLRRIKDPLNELHEKAVTFEGGEQFSESLAVPADALATEVQRICKHIVEHIAETSSGQSLISRMVLHFKVDAKNKIWLLWCSSIRLFRGPKIGRHVTPLNLDPPFQVKSAADAEKKSKHGGGLGLGGLWFVCPGCGETYASDRKCDVTYKAVINHWEKACASPGREAIPPVISKASPGLSEARFAILREHPVFLYKTVPLCESCCTERNNAMLAELAAVNPASDQGEAPAGGRRLGIPSLAGAFRKLGTNKGGSSTARARVPATSRPAPKPAAAGTLRPRPRSAFASIKRGLSGATRKEESSATVPCGPEVQAEGTNERTEESGGESGMIDGETEEGTRSAENETSKETGEGDEGSGAASSQEDSGGKESTVKKAEKTERSSNNGTEAEASKRGNDVDRKGGGDGLPAEATEQCGELRETSPPETASGGLLEDAERNDEHVKRKAESSETTGGGKGAGKAAAENGTSCPDSARGKRNGTEAHVVRPGGRNGGGNRKEERKRNGSSGRKELKEGTSKAADGSSAVDRARAVYSKKINPIWAVPKT